MNSFLSMYLYQKMNEKFPKSLQYRPEFPKLSIKTDPKVR